MRVRVEDEKAGHALGMSDRPRQPDRPAPVLGNDDGVAQIERLEQGVEALHVARYAVQLGIGRLVRASEAEMVRHDRAVARPGERTDELAIQKAPGWVAIEEH